MNRKLFGFGFAAAPAGFFAAGSEDDAAEQAESEETDVHDGGGLGDGFGFGDERRQRERDAALVVHAHDDEQQGDGDEENGFEHQFGVHETKLEKARAGVNSLRAFGLDGRGIGARMRARE